jgi:hypothetical protein
VYAAAPAPEHMYPPPHMTQDRMCVPEHMYPPPHMTQDRMCVCGGARSRTQCNTILKHTICIHTQKLTYKKNILKKKGIDADTCSSCNALLGREECEGEECEGEECEGDRCARAARISASLSCLAFRL